MQSARFKGIICSLNIADEVRETGASCRLNKGKKTGHGGNLKHMSVLQLYNISLYRDALSAL